MGPLCLILPLDSTDTSLACLLYPNHLQSALHTLSQNISQTCSSMRNNYQSSLSLSSYGRYSSLLLILLAFCWTCSSMSMSHFNWEAQNGTHYSRSVSPTLRAKITSLDFASNALRNAAQHRSLECTTSYWPPPGLCVTHHIASSPEVVSSPIHLTVFIQSILHQYFYKTVSKALLKLPSTIPSVLSLSTEPIISS